MVTVPAVAMAMRPSGIWQSALTRVSGSPLRMSSTSKTICDCSDADRVIHSKKSVVSIFFTLQKYNFFAEIVVEMAENVVEPVFFFALQLLQLLYQPSQLGVSIISVTLLHFFYRASSIGNSLFKTTTIAFKVLLPIHHTLSQQIYSCTECLWPAVSRILIQRFCSLYRLLYMDNQHLGIVCSFMVRTHFLTQSHL